MITWHPIPVLYQRSSHAYLNETDGLVITTDYSDRFEITAAMFDNEYCDCKGDQP
jgi:hypothetical protein